MPEHQIADESAQILSNNLRNAANTFGTESKQYKMLVEMVREYIARAAERDQGEEVAKLFEGLDISGEGGGGK